MKLKITNNANIKIDPKNMEALQMTCEHFAKTSHISEVLKKDFSTTDERIMYLESLLVLGAILLLEAKDG